MKAAGRWGAGSILTAAALSLLLWGLVGCDNSFTARHKEPSYSHSRSPLEVMSVTWGANLKFEQNFVQSFGERNGITTQFVPNTRLEVYRRLLRAHSGQPDLLEIDVVWPSILADDLIDLRPYLKEGTQVFPEQLLQSYIVRGRLVALPVYVDVGVLYYRPEILEKYGFQSPPKTWEELEAMASRIQRGERRAGNKDFWGYVWQGSAGEAGTCNFLEWQASAGSGNFIEGRGTVNVRSARFANVLRRGANWIGTISPPAEYVYREDDSANLWDAGQTAFMRNWASGYEQLAKQPGKDRRHFEVAPMPGGPGGRRGTLGGLGIAVSKYAANRELAIKALLELTSERNDLARLYMTEGIPTHTALFNRSDVKSRSHLLALSGELMSLLVTRPALVTGEKYDLVSRQYSVAVNSVLRRKATPEAAMADLEEKLVKITGLPPERDRIGTDGDPINRSSSQSGKR